MKSIEFYFNLIYKHYNTQIAKRSKVPLIAHIIEGVNVLIKINASENAIKAFMIHPLVQDDSIVGKYKYIHAIDSEIMLLAMEYRSVANSYLSKRSINNIDEITLSPLKDVNDMLIADKVQNYKDFLHYHKDKHERSNELDVYFNNWFKRLNVDFESLVDVCYNTAVTIRIKNNNKYLLLNRYLTDRTYVGQCHPGGKLEYKETLFEGLKREVKEEISVDLNIEQISFFDVFFAKTKKGVKSVFVFETEQEVNPILNTDEFESLTWASQEEWDHYWNNDVEVDYEKHNFYAVDLDNTVLEDKYPLLGDFLPNAIDSLKQIVENPENHIIIWTMRDSSQYEEIRNMFKNAGIRLLAINEHLTQHEWTDSKKLYADFFIDDRNISKPIKNKKIIWNI